MHLPQKGRTSVLILYTSVMESIKHQIANQDTRVLFLTWSLLFLNASVLPSIIDGQSSLELVWVHQNKLCHQHSFLNYGLNTILFTSIHVNKKGMIPNFTELLFVPNIFTAIESLLWHSQEPLRTHEVNKSQDSKYLFNIYNVQNIVLDELEENVPY